MKRLALTILFGTCFAVSVMTASVMPVFTPADLSANDSYSWAHSGTDRVLLGGNAFQATSAAGLVFTVSLNNTQGSFAVVCPAVSCSWVDSGTGFSAGDTLLWTSHLGNASGGSGPLSLSFPAISGVGLWIQPATPGMFTAQILAASGATKMGPFSATSNAAGDPLFLGVVDNNANITQVFYSLTEVSGGGDIDDFAVDTVFFRDQSSNVTSEPSSVLLLASGIAALLLWTHARRLKRASLNLPIDALASPRQRQRKRYEPVR